MKANLFYEEVSNYVEKHYLVRPELKYVNSKTIEFSCKPAALIPTITIQMHIEEIQQDVIKLSYDCGISMTLIIAGAVKHLEEKIPHCIDINTDEKRITIQLSQIEKLKKPLEYLKLEDISIKEDSLELALSLI